jgi:Rrf2 family protein
MKLTRATNYALHALVHLARSDPRHPVASHVIAQTDGIPERFILKVLKPLVSARILYSVKGPNGGFLLARPPQRINLLEVVEAVEGPVRGQAPVLGKGEGTVLDRRLGAECGKLAELIRARLRKVSVKDLVGRAKPAELSGA